MDVKVIAEGGMQFVLLGIVGTIVSWFSFWIKETLSRRDAYRKFQNNPFAKVGANLHECETLEPASHRRVQGRQHRSRARGARNARRIACADDSRVPSRSCAMGGGGVMAKYRKLPVVIEAFQWFKNGDHPDDGPAAHEGNLVRYYRHPANNGRRSCDKCNHTMHDHGWIDTLEGGHAVCVGDWIIKGVKGEFYPCKPDIFAATYELAKGK